jgi:exosome complex component RRP41
MTSSKRLDGRGFEETREIEAKIGIVKRADGSAMFRMGKTVAYAAVYGPRDLYPKFLQNPEKGIMRCNYNMMPFSGQGERVRPGPSRRSREIGMVTEKALSSVVNLDEFKNAVVDVFIEFPQTDAGSRCTGICAAALALADAGITMKDLVAAVAVGKVGDRLAVDLSYEEEALKDPDTTDIPMAFVPSTGEIVLLQMDGIISKDELMEAIELGKNACKKLNEIQVAALKKKFEVDKNE